MGLQSHHIHTLCIEQKKRGFVRGDIITLGQQSVWLDRSQSRKIFRTYNLKEYSYRENFESINKIKSFKNTRKENNISCQELLTIMGANKVEAMDFSDYENADIIHDLNYPISEKLFNKYDAVIDSGTLEHIFDIPTALKNICDMLKPGGSLFLSYPSSNFIDHGFYSFSPTLFFDYFASNGFTNLNAYLREGSSRIYDRKGRLFEYRHTIKEKPLVSSGGIEVLFFAQKTEKYKSNKIKKPTQFIYKSYESANNFDKISSINFKKKLFLLIRKLSLLILKFLPYEVERVLFNFLRRKASLKYIGKF